ncbi:hypothetical protein JCM14469_26120 [Desulfatiferula olefinivorans]
MKNDCAVIRPVAGKKNGAFGTVAVLSATRPDLDRLARTLGCDAGESRPFFNARRFTRVQDGRGFSLVGPVMGAPHAVMLLENLIGQGIDRLVFMGWCGSVSPEARIGDILMPTSAFSDEGTSRHYGLTDPSFCVRPDGSFQQRIDAAFDGQNLPIIRGPVWTTDAIYRETPDKIDHYRNRGALGVDMELSALFTVSAFRSVALASVLVVSDEVWTYDWKPGFGDSRFKQSRTSVTDTLATQIERMAVDG